MIIALWIGFCCLTVVALVQLALMIVLGYENLRSTRRRMSSLPISSHVGRVALLAPCKGLDEGLAENLRPLLEQDYADYEVHFIVESPLDPAYTTIRRLLAEYPEVDAHLVISGRARHTGQKIHNLLTAIDGLSSDVEILAFVDSDARPQPHWLRLLVSRLDLKGARATTGYRVLLPVRRTLSNQLLYSINSFVVSLYGSGGYHPVWGGSWSIRREVFEELGIAQSWRNTLSDDFVATRVLHEAGLRVDYEPRCVVASPLDYSPRGMLEFMRRQYKLGRFYAHRWWLISLVTSTIATLALGGSLTAGIVGLAQGATWTWLPLTIAVLLYGGSVLRNFLRQQITRKLLPELDGELAASRRFDMWAAPLVGFINWLGLCSSVYGDRVSWRGVDYHLNRDGKIQRLRHDHAAARHLWEAASQMETPTASEPRPQVNNTAAVKRSGKRPVT